MVNVFFSYSHADEALRDQIQKQLSLLQRQGVVQVWHDRRIGAGEDFADAIDQHVEQDDIILLLVSADFLASDYCYEKEMLRAMERHKRGDAVLIPVILRACDWHGAPFGKLNATPPDGKPITQYPDRDQAMLEVAKAVRQAAERIREKRGATVSPSPSSRAPAHTRQPAGPRSSNLRLAKQFSEREKDAFRVEAFEFIANFFENSLSELERRNAGVEGAFRRVDGNRFQSVVYQHGRAVSRCTVFMGGRMFGNGIAYVQGETSDSNSYNEMISVEADDDSIFLRAFGMFHGGGDRQLTQEGAAELYWSMLIGPLQGQ